METVAKMLRRWSEFETWRDIDVVPGYQVSSFGRVRGKARDFLTPSHVAGYEVVSLSGGGVVKNYRVHILIAQAFYGPAPFVGALVAHNDGKKTNNRVDNLRWASATENQRDRVRHGTHRRGSSVFGAKLTESDIPVIRQRLLSGESQTQIGVDFGVSKHTIHMIAKNKTWKAAGGASWHLSKIN